MQAGSIFKSQCIYHINRKKTLSHQMLQEKILTKFNIYLQIKILNFQLTNIEKSVLQLEENIPINPKANIILNLEELFYL